MYITFKAVGLQVSTCTPPYTLAKTVTLESLMHIWLMPLAAISNIACGALLGKALVRFAR